MVQTWAVLAPLFLLLNILIQSPAYNIVNVEAGYEAVLSCPFLFNKPLLMVTWKMKFGTYCLLAYRYDKNETRNLNCSERMTWKYSPVSNPALRIYPVDLSDEGNYTCEIVNSDGNFHFFSYLAVIVPPTVTLTTDNGGAVICQASAGKPAAEISWVPANNHSIEKEIHHPNGTITRVSSIDWKSNVHPTVTCLVTHPATNKTLSVDLLYASLSLYYLMIGGSVSVAAAIAIGVILCLIFRCKASCLCKSTLGPEAPVATRNYKPATQYSDIYTTDLCDESESIYQNYNPRIM